MNIRNIIYPFLVALFAVIAQSCVNDYDDGCDGIPDGKVTFRFNLNLGDIGHISRADGVWNPSGPSDEGSSFDNTIKMNDKDIKWLHIMLINNAGDLLHLDLDDGYQFNAVEGGYDMTGSLSLDDLKGWSAGVYRIMVLANFRDKNKDTAHVRDQETLEDFEKFLKIKNTGDTVNWYNDGNGTRQTSNIPNIPMWGMTTARLNLDGITVQSFSVELLRAIAKVKIELTQKLRDAGYKLVECTTDNWNQKAYFFPDGWQNSSTTSDYSTSYYDVAFHEVKSRKTNLTVNAPGYPSEHDGDGSIVYYLPEWDAASAGKKANITVYVSDDTGNIESCDMTIDNIPDGSYNEGKYHNNRYNVNRNHLYKFTIDKDIKEGELSYKIECWNLVNSAIGWNPSQADWTFESTDNEAKCAYVAFPSYPTNNDDIIEKYTSYADYKFTLTAPEGAVWKAFLVENGVEYTAETRFSENADGTIHYDNLANTPDGFFFGVGNDDDGNNKAATTGIARSKAYNIKVGTRLLAVNYPSDDKHPDIDPENPDFVLLNNAGNYWKNKGKVPTCYLVIKIALDGKNFSETLAINPTKDGGNFMPYTFAGDDTRIEIRQLFPFYVSKANHRNDERLMVGTHSTDDIFSANTWWGYPMGYNIPSD